MNFKFAMEICRELNKHGIDAGVSFSDNALHIWRIGGERLFSVTREDCLEAESAKSLVAKHIGNL